MVFEFTLDNLDEISRVLDAPYKTTGNIARFEVVNKEEKRRLVVEVNLNLSYENERMNLVSVYTNSSFIQLQNCTAFIASDLLEQVTFFGKTDGTTSGLIIEKAASCSLYANVDERLLTGDFSKLPTELMMSSVALSLTDTIGLDGFSFDEE